jgi:hypothetical protein
MACRKLVMYAAAAAAAAAAAVDNDDAAAADAAAAAAAAAVDNDDAAAADAAVTLTSPHASKRARSIIVCKARERTTLRFQQECQWSSTGVPVECVRARVHTFSGACVNPECESTD